jgi:osmotically inducible protein OsmC
MAGKELYTAHAHVDGGRTDGHGRSDDGLLEVDLRQPGSEDENDGTNPEQLFAVGYGACFDGAVGAVARRQKIDPGKLSIDSAVTLLTGEDRSFTIKVRLDVTLPAVEDAEQAKRIVWDAHQVCPYSNATRGNIEVELTANGEPVDAG